jgi:hypothetical protein
MIRRTRDPELINRLLARDFDGLDFSEVLAEPLNVCLVEDGSGAIFCWRGPGIYEAHVFFAVRGRGAIDLGHRLMNVMGVHYGARLFWALVPVESRKVRMFTRLMGWKSLGVRETRHGFNELFVSGECECLQQ